LLAAINKKLTCLAHDTIAPLIAKAFNESVLAGQLATRILNNKKLDFNNELAILDKHDLIRVQAGENGMRCFSAIEKAFIKRSIAENAKRKQELEEKNKALEVALAKAELKTRESESNRLSNLANRLLDEEKNYHYASVIAAKAARIEQTPAAIDTIYKTLSSKDDELKYHIVKQFKDVTFFHEFMKKDAILIIQNEDIIILNLDGKVVHQWKNPLIGYDCPLTINYNRYAVYADKPNFHFSKNGEYFAISTHRHVWIWNKKGKAIGTIELDEIQKFKEIGFTENSEYFKFLSDSKNENKVHFIYHINGELFQKLDIAENVTEVIHFNGAYILNWIKSPGKTIQKLKETGILLVDFYINATQFIRVLPQHDFFCTTKIGEGGFTFWNSKGAKIIEGASFQTTSNGIIISNDSGMYAVHPNEVVMLIDFSKRKRERNTFVFAISKDGQYFASFIEGEERGLAFFVLEMKTGKAKSEFNIEYINIGRFFFADDGKFIITDYTIISIDGFIKSKRINSESSINSRVSSVIDIQDDNSPSIICGNQILNKDGEILATLMADSELYPMKDKTIISHQKDQRVLNIIALRPLPIFQPFGKNFTLSNNDKWFANYTEKALVIGTLPLREVYFNHQLSYDINNRELLFDRKLLFSPNSEYLFISDSDSFLLHLPTRTQYFIDLKRPYSRLIHFNSLSNRLFIKFIVIDKGKTLVWDIENNIQKYIPFHADYDFFWHPNGQSFLLSKKESKNRLDPQIWNTEDINQLSPQILKEDVIRYSPKGNYLIAGVDAKFMALKTIDGQLIQRFENVKKIVYSFKFSPCERYLCIKETARVYMYNIETSESAGIILGRLSELVFSPQSNFFSIMKSNRLGKIYSINGELSQKFPLIKKEKDVFYNHLAFSPDETMLFCVKSRRGNTGKMIHKSFIIDMEGNLLFDFESKSIDPYYNEGLKFNPKLPYIYWDNLFMNNKFQQFEIPVDFLNTRFSANGKYLIYLNEDNTSKLFPVPEILMELIESNENFDLSDSEWEELETEYPELRS